MSDTVYGEMKELSNGQTMRTLSNKDESPLSCGDVMHFLDCFAPHTGQKNETVTLFSSNSDGKEGIEYLVQNPA